ncbi:unnamed protein product [Didymodactylos carnosus]|nr:unnamed protein product [Didymodactylos carnosus]CAF3966359.1 unnamed protein product [Didymodactylos carnosus]
MHSFELVKKLKQRKAGINEIMASFDVESLYASVPVGEAIDIAVNKIWSQNKKKKLMKLTKNELYILFNLASRTVQFRFYHLTYRQDGGVSMGSPLAPILANLFMKKLENEHILIPGNDRIIKTWIRYVDDIFVILNGGENDALVLLDTINQLHKQIKFTLEIEKDGVLAF